MIDRVLKNDLSDSHLAATVRKIGGIPEQRLDRSKITTGVRFVERNQIDHSGTNSGMRPGYIESENGIGQ